MFDAICETLTHYAVGADGEKARALLEWLLPCRNEHWEGPGWKMCVHDVDSGEFDQLDHTKVVMKNEAGVVELAWVDMYTGWEHDGSGVLMHDSCGLPCGTRIRWSGGDDCRWPRFVKVVKAAPK